MDKETKDNVIEFDQAAQETKKKTQAKPRARKKKQAAPVKQEPQRVRLPYDIPPRDEQIIELRDGISIKVYKRIPFAEKLEAAMKVVSYAVIPDASCGRAYKAINYFTECQLGILEAYTNIEVPDEGREEFFMMIDTEDIMSEVDSIAGTDIYIFREMVDTLTQSVITRFNATNSLDNYMREIGNGTSAGEELLRLMTQKVKEDTAVAQAIENEVEKLQGVKDKNNLIDFSKRTE